MSPLTRHFSITANSTTTGTMPMIDATNPVAVHRAVDQGHLPVDADHQRHRGEHLGDQHQVQEGPFAAEIVPGRVVGRRERGVGPLTLVPPRLELSRLGDEAVALGAVELALADAETRLLPAPGYPG